MFLAIFMAVLGFAIGALLGGETGGLVGLAIGFVFTVVWLFVNDRRLKTSRLDVVPKKEKRKLVCIPNALVAECDLVRDEKTGKWVDVQGCSVFFPTCDVTCEKRCLALLNDSTKNKVAA